MIAVQQPCAPMGHDFAMFMDDRRQQQGRFQGRRREWSPQGWKGNAQPLAIKCMVVGEAQGRCKLVVSPRNIPFTPFKKLLEDKVKAVIEKVSYRDEFGDVIVTDDDVALKIFLEGAGTVHPTKLYLELDVSTTDPTYAMPLPTEVTTAIAVLCSHHNLTDQASQDLLLAVRTALHPDTQQLPPLLTPPPSCKTVKDCSGGITPYKHLIPYIPAALLSPATFQRNVEQARTPSPMREDQLSLLVNKIGRVM